MSAVAIQGYGRYGRENSDTMQYKCESIIFLTGNDVWGFSSCMYRSCGWIRLGAKKWLWCKFFVLNSAENHPNKPLVSIETNSELISKSREIDYIEVSDLEDPSLLVFWGPIFCTLSAVNNRNYHDGKSTFSSLTSFVPINKLYLLTARSYIQDHFDLLWSF